MSRLHRPAPASRGDAQLVDPDARASEAVRRLRAGERLLLQGEYAQGLAFFDALQASFGPRPADHRAGRAWRASVEAASDRLLAPVARHRVALHGAPEIGFLRMLYPEKPDLLLPWARLHDLHEAWWRYDEGLKLPVLGGRIHPFYGVYFPRRHVHLELFATWLSQYAGPRGVAIDVGTGSGILALLLARAGFGEVVATDLNPNAVESVRREIERRAPKPPIRVLEADLLEGAPPADLIVFNPPWTFGPVGSGLDRALQVDHATFHRFFDQAHARLRPGGRLALVYSNLVRLVQPDQPHPIEVELAQGRFELVATPHRRVPPTEGRRTKERVEVWELACC